VMGCVLVHAAQRLQHLDKTWHAAQRHTCCTSCFTWHAFAPLHGMPLRRWTKC
jgi:hypothetical protein